MEQCTLRRSVDIVESDTIKNVPQLLKEKIAQRPAVLLPTAILMETNPALKEIMLRQRRTLRKDYGRWYVNDKFFKKQIPRSQKKVERQLLIKIKRTAALLMSEAQERWEREAERQTEEEFNQEESFNEQNQEAGDDDETMNEENFVVCPFPYQRKWECPPPQLHAPSVPFNGGPMWFPPNVPPPPILPFDYTRPPPPLAGGSFHQTDPRVFDTPYPPTALPQIQPMMNAPTQSSSNKVVFVPIDVSNPPPPLLSRF